MRKSEILTLEYGSLDLEDNIKKRLHNLLQKTLWKVWIIQDNTATTYLNDGRKLGWF
jgi:hypothetical protein